MYPCVWGREQQEQVLSNWLNVCLKIWHKLKQNSQAVSESSDLLRLSDMLWKHFETVIFSLTLYTNYLTWSLALRHPPPHLLLLAGSGGSWVSCHHSPCWSGSVFVYICLASWSPEGKGCLSLSQSSSGSAQCMTEEALSLSRSKNSGLSCVSALFVVGTKNLRWYLTHTDLLNITFIFNLVFSFLKCLYCCDCCCKKSWLRINLIVILESYWNKARIMQDQGRAGGAKAEEWGDVVWPWNESYSSSYVETEIG